MAIKAFPTAQGYARNVTGGRNGQVVFVTNLNDSGAGSLRDTLLIQGEKMVCFRTSGTIVLQSEVVIRQLRSNMTILGMVSNGKGICIAKNKLRYDLSTNHIIRYIRVRKGDDNGTPVQEDDALECRNASNNVIFDHCSFSWGTDETASIYQIENATIQNCIWSEGLNVSGKPQIGGNAFGGIVGGNNFSFLRNLTIHMWLRGPSIADGARIDMANNYTYNWGFRNVNGAQSAQVNIYYNYYKGGPATALGDATVRGHICQPNSPNYGSFYLEGNELEGNAAITANNWLGMHMQNSSNQAADREAARNKDINGNSVPFSIPSGTYEPFLSITQTKSILNDVGCSFQRDSVDQRLVFEAQNGTSTYFGSVTGLPGIIDSQVDVGGFPDLSGPEVTLDGPSPHFLPEWFTIKYGMSTSYDYTLAGTPITRPERFIIFGKADEGIQLSQYVGSVDYDNDLIYNVYEVLSFHVTGEINILEPKLTYTLTVSSTGNGTTNITTATATAGQSIALSAIPNSGYRYDKWERLIGATWTDLNALASFNFIMPSVNTSVRVSFVLIDGPTVPPVVTGDRFFARII